MILTSNLRLNNYSDITIYDSYDETDDAIFVCGVDFTVTADENGLFYDIHKIHDIHLEYVGIMHGDSDDETTNETVDLNDYEILVYIEKGDDEKKSVTIDNVEIDIAKRIVKIYFIN